MRTVIALIALGLATPSVAQETVHLKAGSTLVVSRRALTDGLEKLPPAQASQSRDSLKNGVIIGAVIGAVAMGAFAGWLCHELQEPGEPTCWRSVPIGGLYGAAIGAAAGAGIDALAARSTRLTVPPERGPQTLGRERD